MFIAVTVIVIAVLVVAAAALVSRRLHFGNTSEVDRVRLVDARAAARIEEQRAEHGVRGMGQRYGGF